MVRHRNHLGCATLDPVNFMVASTPLVNFTSASTATFGATATSARKLLEAGVYGLYAGNTNLAVGGSPRIKYSGASNDPGPIAVIVGGSLFVPGYYIEDVNLNGQVRYSGSGNDVLLIQNNAPPPPPFPAPNNGRLQEPAN